MCIEIQLSESKPDLRVTHEGLQAECYIWHKNCTTMRVTILVGGQSRMFDVTKRGIRERRD